MLFTDIVFAPFLLLTFLLFTLARSHRRSQLVVFLLASYVFYGWWDVRFITLILFSTLLDFNLGRRIHEARGSGRRRLYLGLSLAGNLGLLGYFKYAGFFVDNVAAALTSVGMPVHWANLEIVLPVGISFYTFQTLSYTLDIYFERLEPTDSLLEFMVFVAAFPQLVAGPIVRAAELLPQLKENLFRRSDSAGLFYIAYGLSKKVFVADPLGRVLVDKVHRAPEAASAIDALLSMYGFCFQVFLDFSAYSDIALGLGLIFGLVLPVNFRSPYHAWSPAEFWRRWHITLYSWFRDYVFIPLGSSRVSLARVSFNTMVVMLLSGLWHGASWTFVLWGGLHGACLVIHRLWVELAKRRGRRAVRGHGWRLWLKVALFFHVQAIITVFFRASDVGSALTLLGRLLSPTLETAFLGLQILGLFAAAIFFHSLGDPRLVPWSRAFGRLHWSLQGAAVYLFVSVLVFVGRNGIINKAFIYYQF